MVGYDEVPRDYCGTLEYPWGIKSNQHNGIFEFYQKSTP